MKTKTKEELRAEMRAELEKASDIATKAEEAGRDFTADERKSVTDHVEAARELKTRIEELDGDDALKSAVRELTGGIFDGDGKTRSGLDVVTGAAGKTLGEMFTNDESVKAWLENVKSLPKSARVGASPAMALPGLKAFGAKDIVTGGSDTSAGALVREDWRGLLDGLGQFQRPLTIANLVSSGSTGSDSVSYARVTGFTNNADVVPEASGTSAGDASGDVTGEKPESDLELETIVEPVKTIAHWVPATKRALSDAAQIRTLIDSFLRYGLDEELEDQITTGDGTGENFEGILTVSGTTPQAWDTDLLVTTRKAKTKVKTQGRATPTAYVFNPEDNERIDLLKDANGAFYFGGPVGVGQQGLWGLPRIESEAVPAGTGIVADWRQAVLWDREQAGIVASDSHADFFVRNLVAILAELRAAFGIIRPAAFVIIDLTA